MDPPITCAIHQPNLFPRLSTLAKIYAADVWVVLDDVQLNHRDYQHRARLAAPNNPLQQQWLSLPIHKPFGRPTRINEALLQEPDKSARRVQQLVHQYYGHAPHWHAIRNVVAEVATAIALSTRLADVTEVSTRLLLRQLGWRGHIVRSSALAARPERSARLADLSLAVGADEYFCGTGGSRYLDERPFEQHGIRVRYVSPPHDASEPSTRRISALHRMATTNRADLDVVFDPRPRLSPSHKALHRLRAVL